MGAVLTLRTEEDSDGYLTSSSHSLLKSCRDRQSAMSRPSGFHVQRYASAMGRRAGAIPNLDGMALSSRGRQTRGGAAKPERSTVLR